MKNYITSFITKLFLLLLSTSYTTFAQKGFSEGFILTVKNDTLRGFISEGVVRQGVVKTILLRKDIKSPETKSFKIEELVSVFFKDDNEIFLSKTVDIDKKTVELSALDRNLLQKIERQTVLLKTLVSGKCNLYKFIDENKKVHFFFEKNDEVKELIFLKYINVNGQIAEVHEYRNQLKNLFQDCDKIKTASCTLSENELTKLFFAYNRCMGDLPINNMNNEKTIANFNLIGGVSLNKLFYQGRDNFNGLLEDYA